MDTTKAILQGTDTVTRRDLCVSFELGDKKWKVTTSDGCHTPSQHGVDAGDKDAVLELLRKAKTRCKLEPRAMVHSCYEAGRDGWWLHRWLIEQGIDNIVVDSASIEVNRRARRAKTDRLDGCLLDDGRERLLGRAPRLQELGEVAALAQLGDLQLDAANARVPAPVSVAIAAV